MSITSLKSVATSVALAGALFAAEGADAQAIAGGLANGQVATGAVGPSVAARIGYGVDLEDTGINPFGFGLGLEFAFAAYNVPIAISGEFDYYIGESVSYGGIDIRQNIMHGLIWLGYNRAIGNRFVLRPSVGGGFESIRISGGGASDGLLGGLIGLQGHGLVFVTDNLYIDAILRLTISLHGTSSYGGYTAVDGIAGLQFFVGAGYTFGGGGGGGTDPNAQPQPQPQPVY